MSQKLVVWFEGVGRESVPLVGGKGANLGEMVRIGIPVPRGFCISTAAYKRFVKETGVLDKISPYLTRLSKQPEEQYNELSKEIRQVIEGTQIQRAIQDIVIRHYDELCEDYGIGDMPVGVRSSGVAEDAAAASFAGQFDTYLNVKGKQELLDSVKKCWASLFTARALAYRMSRGMPAHGGAISVSVQKMINVLAAGICFTIDPVTGNPHEIVIEGNWGLGESVVEGLVTPDRFILNKDTLEIERVNVSEKKLCVAACESGTKQSEVPLDQQNQPCLNEDEVKRVAGLAKMVESHYGAPQDIEWAVDRDLPFPQSVFLLQTRPVTTIPTWKDPVDKALDRLMSFLSRIE